MSRTTFRPQVVIPNKTATPPNSSDMSEDIISAPTVLQSLSLFSYAITWDGVNVDDGYHTVAVQGSNDFIVQADGYSDMSTADWANLVVEYNGNPVTTIPLPSDSGTGIIDAQTSLYAVRLVYTTNGGTGTIKATINGKVT